ncbi:hypothetical protein CP980_31610 [Streptomyces vinaceus]|uniref:Uncharacterized protein n=1 Tax=Streptomyces vinaceus TaxID=1960 RepID=A0A5J6JDP4_STRVI|nr:hypothetical protein CP980_31610 [Streptomyces vinaceus]GHE39335.1 hypothetical protein GCM10017778_23490 [Streptomyces vinaceus]
MRAHDLGALAYLRCEARGVADDEVASNTLSRPGAWRRIRDTGSGLAAEFARESRGVVGTPTLCRREAHDHARIGKQSLTQREKMQVGSGVTQ